MTEVPEKGKLLSPADIETVKGMTIFDQESVNYTTLSPQITSKACANCVFYRSTGYDGVDWPHCHLVDGWPLPIEPTGLCDEWRLLPAEEIIEPEPIPVVIVGADVVTIEYEQMSMDIPKTMLGKVKEFIGNLGKPNKPQAFAVFKTTNGKMGWVSRHTGKWIDREKEILAERSHEAYVDRVQKGKVAPPELWMWHAKGTKHGQAVAVWKSGGFVLAAGLIDDTPEGESMFRYYEKNSGKIKLSHMFHYPSIAKIDGVYHEYNTIEITTLPDGAEAFPYTSFEEINTMALPDVAKNMILEAGGQAMLDRALAADGKALEDTKVLDAMGVASKNYDQYDGSELISAAEKIQSSGGELAEVKTRLEAAETALKAYEGLSTTVTTLSDAVTKLLNDLEESKTREANLLTQMTVMQEKLALFTDLKPPASQSSETLLNDRDKSLIAEMMAEAKNLDTPSLVDEMLGSAPAVSS